MIGIHPSQVRFLLAAPQRIRDPTGRGASLRRKMLEVRILSCAQCPIRWTAGRCLRSIAGRFDSFMGHQLAEACYDGRMPTKYTPEILQEIVDRSDSIADVLRCLNLKQAGGNHRHIRDRILLFGIDTSHFNGTRKFRNRSPRRKPTDDILCYRESDKREQAHLLRRALQDIGRQYRCEDCGLGDVWNGSQITLEVDHTDRDWRNNNEDNLRFLCPNCHSQYGGIKALVVERNTRRNESPLGSDARAGSTPV